MLVPPIFQQQEPVLRPFALAATLSLLATAACAQPLTPSIPTEPVPGTAPTTPQTAAGLEAALRNFPALITGGNVQPVMNAGTLVPKSCPDAGGRVEQKGGPTIEYLGSVPDKPDLCRMKVGGQEAQAWYGIWVTAWPGADVAYRALQRVMNSRTGDVVGFDVSAGQGLQWHDLVRHDGIEEIKLLDKTYRTIKLAHYREGYDGNAYRSVATVWKDLASGMIIYATYNHIAGVPVVDDPLIPTAIVPASP